MSLTPATISHWCDGKLFAGDSGNTATVTNPATGEVTGQVALASVADAQLVIDSAAAAFPAWRDTSLAKRGIACVIGESSVGHKLPLDRLLSTLD